MIDVHLTGDNFWSWLPFAAFWVGLLVLFLCETLRPLHLEPKESDGRLLSNFGLGAVNFLAFALLPLSSVTAAVWAQAHGVGALNQLSIPVWLAVVLTIALRSLAAYGLHVLAHRSSWLWRVHQVHHADTAVDLSTGFRHHPLELLYVAACYLVLAVALGLSPAALIAYEGAAVLLSLWTHANLKLPFTAERLLGAVLVTPALHHVHHSARQSETDSNYGELFSLWDRLFGTLNRLDTEALRAMRPGLGEDHDPAASHLGRQLLLPLRNVPQRAAKGG
jgi:sterol desaturase/sphingolipid hydroxylase (fatty acid hydroxylase superfamily)